jgi:hypothetical protein
VKIAKGAANIDGRFMQLADQLVLKWYKAQTQRWVGTAGTKAQLLQH